MDKINPYSLCKQIITKCVDDFHENSWHYLVYVYADYDIVEREGGRDIVDADGGDVVGELGDYSHFFESAGAAEEFIASHPSKEYLYVTKVVVFNHPDNDVRKTRSELRLTKDG